MESKEKERFEKEKKEASKAIAEIIKYIGKILKKTPEIRLRKEFGVALINSLSIYFSSNRAEAVGMLELAKFPLMGIYVKLPPDLMRKIQNKDDTRRYVG